MFRKAALIFFCLLILQAVAHSQQPVVKPSYENLLERVKKRDSSVDFTQLRLAYTETKEYNPYSLDRDTRKAMLAAVTAKEWEKALAISDKTLAANYLDIMGHVAAVGANNGLNHPEKAEYHKNVYQHLLKSISDSGDGKKLETAFVVISVDEEYALIAYLGMKLAEQSLVEEQGHHYDKLTVTDRKSNETFTYYFNIDKPMDWLRDSLKNKN